MRRLIVITVIVIILLFTGCSTMQVSQDYRSGIDFSHYHTYQWQVMAEQESDDIRVNNPLLHDRIHQSIDRILAMHGYVQKTPADFLVGYTYAIQARLESEPYGTSAGFGFSRHRRFGELGFGDNLALHQYDVGMLAIDFYDAASGALIWRGIGSERVGMHSTPEDTSAFVNGMVNAVLAQFPPPPR